MGSAAFAAESELGRGGPKKWWAGWVPSGKLT